eukprot:4998639-Prymnesium_polylepis.2
MSRVARDAHVPSRDARSRSMPLVARDARVTSRDACVAAACLWSLATSIPLILALKDQKGHGEELRRIGARWGSNRLMVAMLGMLLDA